MIGGDVESQVNQSFRLVWGALARRDMWRRQTKIKTTYSAVSRRLKPQETQSASFAR